MHVATMIDGGFGVDRNWEEAVRWYRSGCEHGVAAACVRLARTFMATRRPATVHEVAPLFVKACEAGDGEACSAAAFVFDAGELVQRDPKRASELLGRACSNGHAASCGAR